MTSSTALVSRQKSYVIREDLCKLRDREGTVRLLGENLWSNQPSL